MFKNITTVTAETKGRIPVQYILSLLPLLACPVGMGLMMWFMMRVSKDSTPHEANQVPTNPSSRSQEIPHALEVPNESPQRTPLFKMLFLCLNWKVVAGLAGVGVIVWVVAPQFLLGAVPLLIVAACPLSMLFMMRGMQDGREKTASQSEQMRPLPALELTREERLFELHSRLTGVQAQQEAITRQIAELEGPEASVVSEAESVARTATKRSAPRR